MRGMEMFVLIAVGAIVLLAAGSQQVRQNPTPTLVDPTWTIAGQLTVPGTLGPWGPLDPGSYPALGFWQGNGTYGTVTG